jgi:hypothetical protein
LVSRSGRADGRARSRPRDGDPGRAAAGRLDRFDGARPPIAADAQAALSGRSQTSASRRDAARDFASGARHLVSRSPPAVPAAVQPQLRRCTQRVAIPGVVHDNDGLGFRAPSRASWMALDEFESLENASDGVWKRACALARHEIAHRPHGGSRCRVGFVRRKTSLALWVGEERFSLAVDEHAPCFLRPEGAATCQPRATPWEPASEEKSLALKGQNKRRGCRTLGTPEKPRNQRRQRARASRSIDDARSCRALSGLGLGGWPIDTQGGALGWFVDAPSGRPNRGGATKRLTLRIGEERPTPTFPPPARTG